MLRVEWQGEELVLLRQRGLWWPRGGVLWIADPHFGKAATFAAAGIPVPAAAQADDLARLDALLHLSAVKRLVVLGDFLHAADSRDDATLSALRTWRARHDAVTIDLVLGNHDRRAGDPPTDLGMTCAAELAVGPFLCRHHPPQPSDACAAPLLAGHLHPAFALPGGGLRLPCFWFTARLAVLPAFGRFTGHTTIRPARGERLYAVGPDGVAAVWGAERGGASMHPDAGTSGGGDS